VSEAVKALLLATAVIVATGATCLADGLFWVVGNSTTNSCDIVTSNPVVYGDI
jgi:hypothetical protein